MSLLSVWCGQKEAKHVEYLNTESFNPSFTKIHYLHFVMKLLPSKTVDDVFAADFLLFYDQLINWLQSIYLNNIIYF